MPLPVQKHLARLIGQAEGRPLYVPICDPPRPGHTIGRLAGQVDDRPLYITAECERSPNDVGLLPLGSYKARLIGQAEGRPLYVLTCCGRVGGSSSSGSESFSQSSVGTSASAGSGSSASGSASGSGSETFSGVSQASPAGSSVSGSGSSSSGSEAVSLPPSLASSVGSLSGSESETGVPSGVLSGVSGVSGSLSGSGSSGSGSRTGIDTSCCPQGVPTILYMSVPGHGSSIPLFFGGCGGSPLSCFWAGNAVMDDCGLPIFFLLTCFSGAFTLELSCDGLIYVACVDPGDIVDCGPPIQLTFVGPCTPPAPCGLTCGPYGPITISE